MKTHLTTAAAVAVVAGSANAAIVTIDNYDLGTTPVSGAVANIATQSFTANVAGIGANDTVGAPAYDNFTYLTSASFSRASSGSGTAGNIYINVFAGGNGNAGTFLGSSTNAIDVNSQAGLTKMTWNFDNLFIADTTAEYSLVFSTTQTNDNHVTARLTAAENGGGFVDTYTGGTTDDAPNMSSPPAWDTRFEVTLDTVAVPEPSSTALLGLGGLALILRRRK